MPKAVIITEKPSGTRDIAGALGGFEEKDGYWESDAYLLSFAVGHLFELLEPEELVAWLGRGLLGEGEPPAGREELAEGLAAGERRIVVIEGAENLFLARVDGYGALAEMAALAGATRLEVFWLLAIEGLAFNHLRAASKELAFLRRVTVLPAWTEEQIRRLEETGRVFRTLTVVAPAGGVVMMRMPGLEGRAF